MRRITGHRHICRFGANNNDSWRWRVTAIEIHASTLHFIAIKYVFKRPNDKQADTQTGKQHTKYQFKTERRKQCRTTMNYSNEEKKRILEYEKKNALYGVAIFAFSGFPSILLLCFRLSYCDVFHIHIYV